MNQRAGGTNQDGGSVPLAMTETHVDCLGSVDKAYDFIVYCSQSLISLYLVRI